METFDALWICVLPFLALAAVLWGAKRRIPRTHGTAGWGKPDRCFKEKHPGGFMIGEWRGKRVTLPRVLSEQHGVIIGGSGTGKSRGFFLPNAANADGTSLVCTDPKGELWRHTSGFHQEPVRFAPSEPDRSSCFNWIPLCRDARIAELCARAIVESGNTSRTEQAWLDLEAAYLSALFSHAATLPLPTPLTAYYLFTRQSQEDLIDQLLASSSSVAQEQAQIFLQTQERMRGSIVPVVAARLQFLRDAAVARFTSASLLAPDFSQLRQRPIAVYWCLRESDIARLRPLTSVFFSLLLDQIGRTEAGSIPVTMLLDEFANIGVIPNFETTISVARGRGVSLWLGVQSLSQLTARYGRENAQTILTNCGTKIALHGLDAETGKYLSETLGEATVKSERRSATRLFGLLPSARVTVSDQESKRFLLTADEVRRIRTDQAIAVVGNLRPMLLTKRFYCVPVNEKPIATKLGEVQAFLPPIERQELLPPMPETLRCPLLVTS
jgi:type IV secretion system protein VirD4